MYGNGYLEERLIHDFDSEQVKLASVTYLALQIFKLANILSACLLLSV